MTAAEETTKKEGALPEALPLDQASAVFLASALRACLHLHRQMGISHYRLTTDLQDFIHPRPRRCPQPAPRSLPAGAAPEPANGPQPVPEAVLPAAPPSDCLSDIQRDLAGCQRCPLASTRSAQVMGQGKIGSCLLIVGDYCTPSQEQNRDLLFGRDEDALLWKMMQAIGLGPDEVYVTNAVKCSPSGEQLPEAGSGRACQGYVHREIALVQPRIILAMGQMAAQAVLGTDTPLFRLRGRLHHSRFSDGSGTLVPVMVSFHPRSLLEQPGMKKGAWHDVQIVRQYLQKRAREEARSPSRG